MFKAWFKDKEPEIYQKILKVNKYLIPFWIVSFIIGVVVYFSLSYLTLDQFLLLTTALFWIILLFIIIVFVPPFFTALKILPNSKHKILVSSFLLFGAALFLGLIALALKTNLFLIP